MLLRQLVNAACRANSLGHSRHPGEDFVERFSATQLDTDVPVSAEPADARRDEVPNSGEAEQRVRVRAERRSEPRQLNKPAGHPGRLGVVSEAHPVANADGDRQDIFESSAQLDAHHVGVRVNAKAVCAENVLHLFCQFDVAGRGDQARRFATSDFLSVTRPGQDDDLIVAEDLGGGRAPAIVAYLHDIVEDTDVTLDDIEAAFDKSIRDDIDALTRTPRTWPGNANM